MELKTSSGEEYDVADREKSWEFGLQRLSKSFQASQQLPSMMALQGLCQLQRLIKWTEINHVEVLILCPFN